jgi:Zn finger protein HypA/HybF involved in hydrogenase expression
MDDEKENTNLETKDEISRLAKNPDILDSIFNEPTTLLKEMFEDFENNSFTSTLEESKDIFKIIEEPTERFVRMGVALSISAAAQWATVLDEIGVDIGEIEGLINQARKQFNTDEFSDAGETIEKLRQMIPDLEEEEKDIAWKSVTTTEEILKNSEGIGASLAEAERALEQAKNLYEVGNYLQVARLTKEAAEAAEGAKDKRIQTTSDALLFTRSVIEESKDIGVDVTEPEAIYKVAKKAYAQGDYAQAAELNAEAEEIALKLQDEHLKKVMELKEKREIMLKERDEAKKEVESEEHEQVSCPTCGGDTKFVKKYNRYWCKPCKKYAPKKK